MKKLNFSEKFPENLKRAEYLSRIFNHIVLSFHLLPRRGSYLPQSLRFIGGYSYSVLRTVVLITFSGKPKGIAYKRCRVRKIRRI